MLRTCPATCRVCGHNAMLFNDTHFTGRRDEQPASARRLAEGHGCEDTETAEVCAPHVAAGECSENPGWMLRKCAGSCGLCRPVCQDHQAKCSAWATRGDCAKNPGWMKRECPASCGMCQSLGDDDLMSADESGKDEL